jgi:hypothetical protein
MKPEQARAATAAGLLPCAQLSRLKAWSDEAQWFLIRLGAGSARARQVSDVLPSAAVHFRSAPVAAFRFLSQLSIIMAALIMW